MAYNTGNPIGSGDPRDLRDNAENLDNAANSDDTTWTDRLGQSRRTMAGIEQNAIAAIQNAGYVGTGTDNAVEDYAAGIEITQYNQIVRDGGEFWRVSGSETLPYTLTGAGVPEGGALVSVGDAALRQDLADGSTTVSSSTGTQTVAESLDDRLPSYNLMQYLSLFDGTWNAAIAQMASERGYVLIPRGEYSVSTITLDTPVYMMPGARLTVATGESVTFINRLHAPAEWVLRGDGDYYFNVDAGGDQGEDSREIYAAWFGVLPTNTTVTDQSERLQKCANSLGDQTREGIIHVAIGSFHMTGGVVLPRGVWLKGAGIRLTIFDITGDGYVVFQSGDDAVRVSDIQFEFPSGATDARVAPFIEFSGRDAKCERIRLWSAENGIIMNGPSAMVDDIEAAYPFDLGSNSSAVLINGFGFRVTNIRQVSSPRGPSAMVEIGRGATDNFGSGTVGGVHWYGPSIGVKVFADNADISNIDLRDLHYSGLTGTQSFGLFELRTANTSSIRHVTINGMNANSLATRMGRIVQASTGETTDVVIGNGTIEGFDGEGLSFVLSSGTFDRIVVSDDVNVRGRETPFAYSGVTSGVQTNPGAMPDANAAICYSYPLADDEAVTIPVRRSIFGCSAIVTGASNVNGILFMRVATSPSVTEIVTGTNISVTTGALTGTTGPDGMLNISADEENIYLENRRGSTMPVNLALLAGAQY